MTKWSETLVTPWRSYCAYIGAYNVALEDGEKGVWKPGFRIRNGVWLRDSWLTLQEWIHWKQKKKLFASLGRNQEVFTSGRVPHSDHMETTFPYPNKIWWSLMSPNKSDDNSLQTLVTDAAHFTVSYMKHCWTIYCKICQPMLILLNKRRSKKARLARNIKKASLSWTLASIRTGVGVIVTYRCCISECACPPGSYG